MNCQCGNPVEPERENLGLLNCKSCAFAKPVAKVKGTMVWDHKTAPHIQIQSAETQQKMAELEKQRNTDGVLSRKGHI